MPAQFGTTPATETPATTAAPATTGKKGFKPAVAWVNVKAVDTNGKEHKLSGAPQQES